MKKEDIKELIIKHSQKVETWINPDGEGYSTDDRWMDSDDINSMTEAIFRLFVVSGSLLCDCGYMAESGICTGCGLPKSNDR